MEIDKYAHTGTKSQLIKRTKNDGTFNNTVK